MAATSPPSFLQASSYGAIAFRRPLSSLIGSTGVVGTTDLKVTAHTPANLSVTVASGQVWMPGNVVTNQADYYGLNNATVNLSIAAASTTTPRIDLVCATVKDAFYAGSTNDWVIEVVTGTAAASPSAPSLPSNSVALAHVAVAAGATTISNSDITDERQRSGVHSVIVGTSAGAPTSGSYATGTGYLDSNDVLWVCTASGTPGTWVKVVYGGDSGWLTVTTHGGFLNGWSQTTVGVAFRKIGNVVRLRGALLPPAGDPSTSVAFALPVGYRPSWNGVQRTTPVTGTANFWFVALRTTGNVVVAKGPTGIHQWLDGISFTTD